MSLARSDVWLDRASTLLMFELLGYAGSMVLFGNEDIAFPVLFIVNLAPASLFAMAAKAQGRSAIGFGLLAMLVPLGSFATWLLLNRSASQLRASTLAVLEAHMPDRYVDSTGVVHERKPEAD